MKEQSKKTEEKRRKKFFEESKKNKSVEEDIDIELIEPNEYNPNVMADDKFTEMVRNMEEIGDVQRVLVVRNGKMFRIVDGEHRYKACKIMGMKKVPCVVVELKNEDREKFISMKMNILKGKIDPIKFTKMALVDEQEFKRIYQEIRKDLPPEIQKKLDETKTEITTIEGLSNVLNTLFNKYGNTLDYNYMWFDYGGKKNLMIQCSKTLWKELNAVADICFEEKTDINELMEKMIKVEYIKDARING